MPVRSDLKTMAWETCYPYIFLNFVISNLKKSSNEHEQLHIVLWPFSYHNESYYTDFVLVTGFCMS